MQTYPTGYTESHRIAEKIFREIFSHLSPGGILSTYCAKGEIRRRLQSVGFTVERLPGPPNGKREILRASKR